MVDGPNYVICKPHLIKCGFLETIYSMDGYSVWSVFSAFYLLDNCAKFKKLPLCYLFLRCSCIYSHYLHNDLKIAFMNVGQGDCIVIELPYRHEIYLIDTGGLLRFEQEAWKERNNLYEVGRQVVVPYLKGRGISLINTFIINACRCRSCRRRRRNFTRNTGKRNSYYAEFI